MLRIFGILCLGFWASLATAKQIPNATLAFVQECKKSANCEVQLFAEISKTYRPSKEEDELRDYVLNLKSLVEVEIWKQKLETFQDTVGNLLIRIPATGTFVQKQNSSPLNYFALQSHMDMVLAYSEAKPGEDLRPYFRDGVVLQTKDGWLMSKDNKTTLGSDNGIGVAFELRYLIDPSISHPPLELIFTVQEEIGLLGAFASELPILSKKMLCLDGMTPEVGFIVAGSQGAVAQTLDFKTTLAQEVDAAAMTSIQVTVTKLAGGHSGGDIHRSRLNAMKAFAGLVKYLSSVVGEVGIKTVIVGDVGVLNKIPNIFQAELSFSKSKMTTALRAQLEGFLRNLILNNADDAKNAVIDIQIKDNQQQKFLTTNFDFTRGIIDSILKSPNGVIDEDPIYFNKVKTSSNLFFLQIKPTDKSEVAIQLGFMTRGFSEDRTQEVASSIVDAFSKIEDSTKPEVQTKMAIPAWMEPDSSDLLKETLTQSGYFNKKFYLNGGLEPSAFKQKIKNLQVLALGPFTQYAHSVNEQLKLDSVPPTVLGIQKIIQNQK